MLITFEKSSLCFWGNFYLVLCPSPAFIPESGTLLWHQWFSNCELLNRWCLYLTSLLFIYLLQVQIYDNRLEGFILFVFPKGKGAAFVPTHPHPSPKHLFSRCGAPFCLFCPWICSPLPAPSTEMTFSEVSNDLSQAQTKTHAPYYSFVMDFSCHLFHFIES